MGGEPGVGSPAPEKGAAGGPGLSPLGAMGGDALSVLSDLNFGNIFQVQGNHLRRIRFCLNDLNVLRHLFRLEDIT